MSNIEYEYDTALAVALVRDWTYIRDVRGSIPRKGEYFFCIFSYYTEFKITMNCSRSTSTLQKQLERAVAYASVNDRTLTAGYTGELAVGELEPLQQYSGWEIRNGTGG